MNPTSSKSNAVQTTETHKTPLCDPPVGPNAMGFGDRARTTKHCQVAPGTNPKSTPRVNTIAVDKKTITLDPKRGFPQVEKVQGATSVFITTGSTLTERDFQYLAKIKTLTSLNMSHCTGVNAKGLSHLVTLQGLTLLKLSWCFGINTKVLAQVSKLRNLVSLNLRGCDGVNSEGLAHVLTLQNLGSLDVSHCKDVKLDELLKMEMPKNLTFEFSAPPTGDVFNHRHGPVPSDATPSPNFTNDIFDICRKHLC